MTVETYRISIPEDAIQKLQQKLLLVEFPDELEEAEWEMGTPLTEMRRLVSYWRHQFDWRKSEREINKLPQFRIPVGVNGFGTLNVHFVHQQSVVSGATPLLFCHGCESTSQSAVG